VHDQGVTDSLAALRAKYEEMRSLRKGDPRNPPSGRAALRQQLAALAARFPGALREIDTLPLDEIDRRIEALELAERDPTRAAAWMHAMARFHALMRGALFVKRSLSGDAEPDRWPDEALVWQDEHARIRRPPEGRLLELVYERLGRELGTTPRGAKAIVFGKSA
jgi:hypothetical protein